MRSSLKWNAGVWDPESGCGCWTVSRTCSQIILVPDRFSISWIRSPPQSRISRIARRKDSAPYAKAWATAGAWQSLHILRQVSP
jgi:hypothetical protein